MDSTNMFSSQGLMEEFLRAYTTSNGSNDTLYRTWANPYLEETLASLRGVVDNVAGVPLEAEAPAPPSEPEVTYENFGSRDHIEHFITHNSAMESIPENSHTLEYRETTSRFSSAVWYDNITTKDVLLVGLGGIGSYVAYNIGRLRPRSITLFDNDIVEAGNMSGQLFCSSDIGNAKVDVTYDRLGRYCAYHNINCYRERFTENNRALPITICGLDNMSSRKIVYQAWKRLVEVAPEEERRKYLFIDGRLAAEELQVFCITGDDSYSMGRYERDWLFSDEEADATICSYKQTTYVANIIGSIITNLFINFRANECDPLVPRDIPFFTSYDAATMFFKTEV